MRAGRLAPPLCQQQTVVRGRVLDAQGRGVAGAWVVALEERDGTLLQSGPDGSFALPIAGANETIVAARGAEFAQIEARANANAPIELRLASAPPTEAAASIESALSGTLVERDPSVYFEALEPERMAGLAARNTRRGGYDTAQWVQQLGERDLPAFARQAPALLAQLGDDQRDSIEGQLFYLKAASPDATERQGATDWVEANKAAKRLDPTQNIAHLLQVAAVARRLQRPDADGLIDLAAALAARGTIGRAQTGRWSSPLARAGVEATARFVAELPPAAQFSLWGNVAGEIARLDAPASGTAAIAHMEELAQTPALVALANDDPDAIRSQLDRARRLVAKAMARSDAAGALKLVEAMENDDYALRARLIVAEGAIGSGDGATARRALEGAMNSDYLTTSAAALAASLGQEVGPDFGAPLWARALELARPAPQGDELYLTTVGMWAFYHARLDAGLSRVLLEREWRWRLPAAVKSKGDRSSNQLPALRQLEMAMGAVDPARALQMHAQADEQLGETTANVGLAAALAMTDAQRARWGVDSRY